MTTNSNKERIDLAKIRARLAGTRGQHYWRSLEEVAETEEFKEFLHREFPKGASEWDDSVSRRSFLKIMGASLALAGLTACRRQPVERIAPYVQAPEDFVPGKPLFFASAASLGGYATGVLVESHEFRPTRIDGNPNHPASLGGADVFTQAEILTMYDPDRSQQVLNDGAASTWDAFLTALPPMLDAARANQGAGLRILTQTVTSPTLASQLQALLNEFPSAKWVQYEPVNRDNERAGALLAFGEYVDTVYNFDQADVVLALDADFLAPGTGNLNYARRFIDRRRVREATPEMNRLYVVESTPSITGAVADHRVPLRASDIESVVRAVAQRLGVAGVTAGALPEGISETFVDALVNDLQSHGGSSLVIAGLQQPPIVHAIVHAINQTLGNGETTVNYIEPVEANPTDQMAELTELVDAMNNGQVEVLLILGGNPVYDTPADLDVAGALAQVGTSIHLSLFVDETSARTTWHIPQAHFLEAWSDVRTFDGTASIVQPLIEPLYGGKSAHEVLAAFLNQGGPDGYEIVRDYWQGQGLADGDFETFWQTAIQQGVIPGTESPAKAVSLQAGFAEQTTPAVEGLELIFAPDPTVWDGRYSNNGWLQELPKPLTKLTWDNAAFVSPATAEQFDLQNGDVITLNYRGRSVNAPVWILPGHAHDAVTVHLGYGRELAGQVGTGYGFNAYAIRPSDAPWFGYGLDITRTGSRYLLATTQDHSSMEGRDLVRVGTIQDYQANPEEPPFMHEAHVNSLYSYYEYENPHQWGMVIDLTACVNCNACVIACQAENSIPVVGKDQVSRAREMHWIRLDRYYAGDLDNPAVLYQPVTCMHCEQAPCEVVCPVAATVHDDEGINNMIYNRCVGTRYCSNNCPYKVRRFNFLQYSDIETPVLKLQRNPDVTVRNRGVMEKCTYCIQRISAARIEAEKENRTIRDGEVITACQSACPTEAIVFGNIRDPESRVAKLKEESLNYGLLVELNTFPRTTYLARVRNPNPEIEPLAPANGQHGTE